MAKIKGLLGQIKANIQVRGELAVYVLFGCSYVAALRRCYVVIALRRLRKTHTLSSSNLVSDKLLCELRILDKILDYYSLLL